VDGQVPAALCTRYNVYQWYAALQLLGMTCMSKIALASQLDSSHAKTGEYSIPRTTVMCIVYNVWSLDQAN
jgi:hypothetical protein